jgi:hypothetical protein
MESHRLLLSFVVFGIIIATLIFSRPSITGFVPTETFSQELDINVAQSQRFTITSDRVGPLRLSSFSLAGTVAGSGLVNVYLTDGIKKWLVFTNKKKPGSAMESITGMTVLNIEPGQKLDKIETLPPGYTAGPGAFRNECIETCILDEQMFDKPELFLDVILEPGTLLHIDEIRFSTSE